MGVRTGNPAWVDSADAADAAANPGRKITAAKLNAIEAAIDGHTHDVGDIDATGTADSTTFLRGDGTWATPAGGGGSVPDASTTVKGVVQLTNHLGGTATAPTVRAASTTQTGIVELATNTEATTGTDTSRAVTPSGVKAVVDARATDYATAAQGDKADAAIPSGLVDAKGDLIVATADNTVTRLPAGTNGHVLTADSAEAAGVKWAAPSGGGGGGFAAPWTRSPNGTEITGLPMGDFVGNGTIAAVAGRFYGNVFYVPASVSVSSLHITITTAAAAGALARLALFQVSDQNNLLSWSDPIDFGTVSIAATGSVSATLGTPATLNAGVWAVALVADTAVTIGAPRVVGRGVTDWTHQIVSNNYRIVQSYQNTINNVGMVAAGITGSLTMASNGMENGASMVPALLGFQWS